MDFSGETAAGRWDREADGGDEAILKQSATVRSLRARRLLITGVLAPGLRQTQGSGQEPGTTCRHFDQWVTVVRAAICSNGDVPASPRLEIPTTRRKPVPSNCFPLVAPVVVRGSEGNSRPYRGCQACTGAILAPVMCDLENLGAEQTPGPVPVDQQVFVVTVAVTREQEPRLSKGHLHEYRSVVQWRVGSREQIQAELGPGAKKSWVDQSGDRAASNVRRPQGTAEIAPPRLLCAVVPQRILSALIEPRPWCKQCGTVLDQTLDRVEMVRVWMACNERRERARLYPTGEGIRQARISPAATVDQDRLSCRCCYRNCFPRSNVEHRHFQVAGTKVRDPTPSRTDPRRRSGPNPVERHPYSPNRTIGCIRSLRILSNVTSA